MRAPETLDVHDRRLQAFELLDHAEARHLRFLDDLAALGAAGLLLLTEREEILGAKVHAWGAWQLDCARGQERLEEFVDERLGVAVGDVHVVLRVRDQSWGVEFWDGGERIELDVHESLDEFYEGRLVRPYQAQGEEVRTYCAQTRTFGAAATAGTRTVYMSH